MIPGQNLVRRLQNRARRELCKRRLDKLKGDRPQVFVDYGWIRLLYTGDGDVQELEYHMNCLPWHRKDIAGYRQYLRPGDTAVDVGANLGFVTTMLADVVGKTGTVFSFEPARATFAKLQLTIRENELTQVRPYRAGCGSHKDTAALHRVSASSGNSSIHGAGRGERIQLVPLDTVSEIMENGVQLVKIDTEGHESEVLKGAKELIKAHRPIIYTELGGGYIESTITAIDLLDQYGYRTDHVRTIEWSGVGRGSDYVFLPR
jgi:FkbM family methyltransferase